MNTKVKKEKINAMKFAHDHKDFITGVYVGILITSAAVLITNYVFNVPGETPLSSILQSGTDKNGRRVIVETITGKSRIPFITRKLLVRSYKNPEELLHVSYNFARCAEWLDPERFEEISNKVMTEIAVF